MTVSRQYELIGSGNGNGSGNGIGNGDGNDDGNGDGIGNEDGELHHSVSCYFLLMVLEFCPIQCELFVYGKQLVVNSSLVRL